MALFFLTSGLFLGWSLGANDASNVFGTAVGSRMIRFRTAAIWCAAFIILGAVISGAGASQTLGRLGAVNALAGAFMVALAAGLSVYIMTKIGYPVSTSQAIVGAIVGWNLFSGSLTDAQSLTKIVSTWIACPVLAAVMAMLLYKVVTVGIRLIKPHMFRLDATTRYALLLVGVFGSYSLGANNIANVMGVFVPAAPLPEIRLFGWLVLKPAQQLFFIGGLAIAAGVMTGSRRVMMTVGEGIMKLSPVAAFSVVAAHSAVLFLFASQGLEQFLTTRGLPAIPLVPVSSTQAIVGAVIGVGLLKGGRAIRWRLLGGIASGWVVTPVIACGFSFVSLFFLQNVFKQEAYHPIRYSLTPAALERIAQAHVPSESLAEIAGRVYPDAAAFKQSLDEQRIDDTAHRRLIFESATVDVIHVARRGIDTIPANRISSAQLNALRQLEGSTFVHPWAFRQRLANASPAWRTSPENRYQSQQIDERLAYLYHHFAEHPETD